MARSYYLMNEVAKMIGMSPRWVQDACNDGRIKWSWNHNTGLKCGRRKHISRDDLVEFVRVNDYPVPPELVQFMGDRA